MSSPFPPRRRSSSVALSKEKRQSLDGTLDGSWRKKQLWTVNPSVTFSIYTLVTPFYTRNAFAGLCSHCNDGAKRRVHFELETIRVTCKWHLIFYCCRCVSVPMVIFWWLNGQIIQPSEAIANDCKMWSSGSQNAANTVGTMRQCLPLLPPPPLLLLLLLLIEVPTNLLHGKVFVGRLYSFTLSYMPLHIFINYSVGTLRSWSWRSRIHNSTDTVMMKMLYLFKHRGIEDRWAHPNKYHPLAISDGTIPDNKFRWRSC